MGTFIAVLIIGFLIFLIVKSSNKQKNKTSHKLTEKTEIPIEIKITTSYGSSSSEKEEKFNPIKQDTKGNWILNPGAPFELTLLDVDKNTAQKVRSVLDSEEIRDYRKPDKLVALFAGSNIRVKEIEDYKAKYKRTYFSRLEELKNNSSEWGHLGEKDKEDLLVEFRQIALNEIYEKADCDLEILFEFEPKDITIDDALIEEYGFENIQTYLNYANNMEKIRVISNDNYSRPMFEKLVEYGLATRGYDLKKDEVLSTLTLKELNTIANNPEKEYKRKNQAIEYILTLDDLEQKIGKHISLRELFKLNPLPQKYSSINLEDIASTWSYHVEEVRLLMNTYRNSYYSWRDFKDNEYVKGYTIEPIDKENPCPCAVECSKKKYSKNTPPKVPCHIGCNCYLKKEYDFSR